MAAAAAGGPSVEQWDDTLDLGDSIFMYENHACYACEEHV